MTRFLSWPTLVTCGPLWPHVRFLRFYDSRSLSVQLSVTCFHLFGQPMAHSLHRHMLSSHLITNVGKLPRQLIRYFSVRWLRDVSHQEERLNDIEKEATAVCDSHFAEEKKRFALQFNCCHGYSLFATIASRCCSVHLENDRYSLYVTFSQHGLKAVKKYAIHDIWLLIIYDMISQMFQIVVTIIVLVLWVCALQQWVAWVYTGYILDFNVVLILVAHLTWFRIQHVLYILI